ncbi:hypothetical protein ACFE04_020130 [Oxalis oulophora]
MVGCKILIKKHKDNTNWLTSLLRTTFYGLCVKHQDLRKSEENVFCLDCRISFCKHCLDHHSRHRHFQICKYVYHDVVRLHDIQKHLDCAKIQTYKINGEKAVHLNPRPIDKNARPSTKAKFAAACEACGRYLQDIPNSYCSIACKLSCVSERLNDEIPFSSQNISDLSWKGNNNENPTPTPPSTSTSDVSSETRTPSELMPRKRLRKRKGIPRRASFG